MVGLLTPIAQELLPSARRTGNLEVIEKKKERRTSKTVSDKYSEVVKEGMCTESERNESPIVVC